MKRLATTCLLAASLLTFGCAADPDEPDGPGAYADLLEDARDRSQKSDRVVSCGDDSCSIELCGYDCTVPGEPCPRACAESDSRAETFTAFAATGNHSASRDSRDLPYEPVVRLNEVLFYGCDLWDFTNGGTTPGNDQGLAIQYSEIYQGAFLAGDPSDKGHELEIYALPFHGPGTYSANGFLSVTSAQREAGDYFFGKDACTVEIEAAGDGIAGTFECASVPHKSDAGRSISLSGSFGCGGNALDVSIIDMPDER